MCEYIAQCDRSGWRGHHAVIANTVTVMLISPWCRKMWHDYDNNSDKRSVTFVSSCDEVLGKCFENIKILHLNKSHDPKRCIWNGAGGGERPLLEGGGGGTWIFTVPSIAQSPQEVSHIQSHSTSVLSASHRISSQERVGSQLFWTQ